MKSTFLVVEQIVRISLASFSDLHHACDQSCCLSGIVLISCITVLYGVIQYMGKYSTVMQRSCVRNATKTTWKIQHTVAL